MSIHNPPYFNKLVIILTTAQQNVFSSKLVAEKKGKSGNALFIRLPRLMAITQTRFRQLYITSNQIIHCYILYYYS